MGKSKNKGFRYYVSEDMLERYQKKPVSLRLQWLYMANVLRKGLSKRTIAMQDRFREGKG
ncbi:MAG: hypothetical protein OEW15_01570 [Nitrospirota bacterium]|nr:hypothetical protein [Nitrospirota bacterium]